MKAAVERIEEYATRPLEETAAGIKASGKTFKMLVRSMYLNPVKAPVREIIHNHLDEHKRLRLDRPIEITMPTIFEPTWRSRDFGESMSHSFMMDGFMTLGESRKEGDHSQAGYWGVGSKSPLAYTDQFTVKCIQNRRFRLEPQSVQLQGAICVLLSKPERSFGRTLPCGPVTAARQPRVPRRGRLPLS